MSIEAPDLERAVTQADEWLDISKGIYDQLFPKNLLNVDIWMVSQC